MADGDTAACVAAPMIADAQVRGRMASTLGRGISLTHNHGGPIRGGVVSGGAARLPTQSQKGQGQSLKADEGRSGGGGYRGLQGFTGRLLAAVKSRAGNVWRTGQWSPADVWRCLAGRLPRHLETGRRRLRLSSAGRRRIKGARLPGCQ